jgi:hypothetical protein
MSLSSEKDILWKDIRGLHVSNLSKKLNEKTVEI